MGVIRFADLRLDPGQRRVWRGSTEIELPKLSFELLAALVESAPNSVSTDELMDRVWNGKVVSPATVAKRVELVRDALGDDSEAPRYVALVRGHGYRLIPEVSDDTPKTPSRRALTWGATAIVIGFLAVITLMNLPEREIPPPDKSIAVLPFVSTTTDPGDEAFADGLTDELSHSLARLGDLKVTGRTSSYYFKGRNEDVRSIGDTLHVRHVLEGSVRRSGETLRVTAKLVDTRDGYQLWSESYDRKMSDVIDIQKDIATSVAARLQASMSSEGPISIRSEEAVSPEAYALYLRAVSLSPYGKTRNLAEPQALLERVVEMAPDFAPGWTRLAAVHGRRAVYGDPGYDLTKEETLLITGHAIRRAFELDPENGEIYAFLGGAAWVFERDLVKAAPLIERAIALDPWNLDFISFAADFAKNIGRLDDALELEQVLVVRDPLCNTCRLHLALSYLYAQRYGDATTQYRLLQSINGGYHWTLGVLALLQEEPEMAIEEFENLAADAPLRALGQAMAWHDLGRLEDSRRALAGVEGRAGNVSPIMLAETLAYVGERDRAFEWLDRSLPADTLVMQTSFPHPLFNSLHADPRWSELLRRIGRSPDDLDEIPFSLDGPRARLGLPDR